MIELGAGNGLNFTHYPPSVSEVVAIEPEDRLRALAEHAAGQASVAARVVAAHAEDLPFDNGSFGAAVASLVLCSVPDPHAALRRVLTPTGKLRFFEHVRSTHPARRLAQNLLTPLWSRIGGGCHLNRDTAADIRAAGFTIEQPDRVTYAPFKLAPPQTHLLGRATTSH